MVEVAQPAAPSAGDERPDRVEPHAPGRAPTSRRAAGSDRSRAWRSWTKIAPDRARPAVQVLVGAPRGEVDVPVVERELDVARGVGQVPADDRAGGVPGRGQPLDLERLAGREVDPGQEDEREVVGRARAMAASRSSVRTRCLAVARADDDEVRRRVEPALGEVARQRVAVGREERAVGQDPPAPAVGPEERGEQEMDVDGQAVEQRRPRRGARRRSGAIGSRSDLVQGEPRTAAGRTRRRRRGAPRRRARSSMAARRGPRLQPERLAGQVDRRRCRRAPSGCGTGRASPASAPRPHRASRASSSVMGRSPVSVAISRTEGSIRRCVTHERHGPRPSGRPSSDRRSCWPAAARRARARRSRRASRRRRAPRHQCRRRRSPRSPGRPVASRRRSRRRRSRPTVRPPGQERTDAFGIAQVWVPAGTFTMGTDADAIAALEAQSPAAVGRERVPERGSRPTRSR